MTRGIMSDCLPEHWNQDQKIRAIAAHIVRLEWGGDEPPDLMIARALSMSDREALRWGWHWVGPERER